jgi:restriction system protein
MAIPDFQSIMRPLLEVLQEKDSCSIGDLRNELQKVFSVSAEERRKLLPSGRANIFDNRVAWAGVHLRMAGLLERPTRGFAAITENGRQFLERHKGPIKIKNLDKIPGYKEAKKGDPKKREDKKKKSMKSSETPQEVMEEAYGEIRDSLVSELLEQIMKESPSFFEGLVIDLLVGMGYGGSFQDAAETLGRAGDGGIDGVIKQDVLGLDSIYVQAKRWKDKGVGRPDIQAFVGSLEGRHANKGVFITTSRFSDDAQQYAKSIAKRVILIDGEKLCEHMIKFKIGVRVARSYDLPAIDLDYFESEQ